MGLVDLAGGYKFLCPFFHYAVWSEVLKGILWTLIQHYTG